MKARAMWAAPLLGAALLLASCGISADSEPRALPVTTTTTTVRTAEPSGDQRANIYLVTNSALVPTIRRLPARTPTEVMNSLLIPPSSAEGESLSSSIPAATRLLGLEEADNGLLKVDLSSDFEDVQGDARVLALGQIVMSLTELPGVDRLQFFIEGEPLKVFSGERGDVDTVNACDYAERLRNPDDANTTGRDNDLTPGQLAALTERRDELMEVC